MVLQPVHALPHEEYRAMPRPRSSSPARRFRPHNAGDANRLGWQSPQMADRARSFQNVPCQFIVGAGRLRPICPPAAASARSGPAAVPGPTTNVALRKRVEQKREPRPAPERTDQLKGALRTIRRSLFERLDRCRLVGAFDDLAGVSHSPVIGCRIASEQCRRSGRARGSTTPSFSSQKAMKS